MVFGGHILGIPVEENLPYIAPFFGGGITVWGYLRWKYRKCSCCNLRGGGCRCNNEH